MNKVLDVCDKVMYGGLLLLVIFVPYSSAMIEAGLIIMMISWIVKHSLIWRNKPQQGFLASYSFSSTHLKWPLIVIGLLIFLTIPFSHAPALSLKKFFSRFLQQILLMYLVAEIINSPKRFFQVLFVLMWTLLVVNADIIVQYFRGHSFIFNSSLIYHRVSGPMRHPNDLGTLLVTVLPVILALLLTKRFWVPLILPPRFLWIVTAVMGFLFVSLGIALGLTSSRGAWLAFFLTMIGFGMCLGKARVIGWIICILVVFLLVFGVNCINVRKDIIPPEVVSVENNIQTTSIKDDSKDESKTVFSKYVTNGKVILFNTSRRSEYWSRAEDIIKRYPVFGCGYNAYIQTLQQLNIGPMEYPHNSLLQIGAELGILGLLAHLWFFFSLIRFGIKTLRTIKIHDSYYVVGVGLFFGIIGWLIHSVTDTAWESLQLNILWWFLIGVLMSMRTIFQQSNTNKGVL